MSCFCADFFKNESNIDIYHFWVHNVADSSFSSSSVSWTWLAAMDLNSSGLSLYIFAASTLAGLSTLGSANMDITESKTFSTLWTGLHRSELFSYPRGSSPGACKMLMQTLFQRKIDFSRAPPFNGWLKLDQLTGHQGKCLDERFWKWTSFLGETRDNQ